MGKINIVSGKKLVEVKPSSSKTIEIIGQTYVVVFRDYDNSILKSQTVLEGEDASPPQDPLRTGYNFSYWSGSYINVNEDETVIAQYTKKNYDVIFYDWDGSILSNQSVPYLESATAPPSPSRDYFSFSGWIGDYTNIEGPVVVVADYTPLVSGYYISASKDLLEYSETATFSILKYDSNLPDPVSYSWSASNLSSGNYNLSSVFSANSSIQNTNISSSDDIGLINCYIEIPDGPAGSVSSESITLNKVQYSVVFYDWDDTVLKSVFVDYGASASTPTDPVRQYYNFTGWNSSDYINVTSDVSISAQYTVDITQFSSLQLSSVVGSRPWTAEFTLTNNNNISVSADYVITEGREPNEVTVETGTVSWGANNSITITWDNSSTTSYKDINFYYYAKKDGQQFDDGFGTVNVAPFEETTTTV